MNDDLKDLNAVVQRILQNADAVRSDAYREAGNTLNDALEAAKTRGSKRAITIAKNAAQKAHSEAIGEAATRYIKTLHDAARAIDPILESARHAHSVYSMWNAFAR